MTTITRWRVGDQLAPLDLPPVSRTMLALFAGGSGDHNPLHVDIDFAREHGGMDDVIGHGMFGMALLGRYVTQFADQTAIRDFAVRFLGMTRIGDRLSCVATVERIDGTEDAGLVELSLLVTRQNGDRIMTGTVLIDRHRGERSAGR